MAMRRTSPFPRPASLRWPLPSGLAVAVGAAALWQFGGALSVVGRQPLDNPYDRLFLIVLAVVVWLGSVARALVARRFAGPSSSGDAGAPARAERDRVRLAVAAAARRVRALRVGPRNGGRAVYQLPWYLVLGAHGCGKSAAAAALAGKSAEDGGQGYRFIDNAVLFESDGGSATAEPGWRDLLDAIKSERPRRPLNGVILAIDLAELVRWNARERHLHGEWLHRRLSDLGTQLGLPPLVYVVATKADRIPGFTAFFDQLPADERARPWGAALPFSRRDATPLEDRVRAIFQDLARRLDERRLDRLYQEPDLRHRAAAFGFPLSFAALEAPMRELLAVAFAEEPGTKQAVLRGLYFTAARPDGQDESVDGLAAIFGLPAPMEPKVSLDGPAPFFLTRLLPDALVPEADLAGEDRGLKWRRRIVRGTALLATLAIAAGVSAYWLNSYRGNTELIAEAAAGVTRIEAELKALDTPPRSLARVDDTDFQAIVPVLDAMRALPGGYAEGNRWPSFWLSGGLYQGGRIGRPARAMYARALRSLFLSRLTLRVEDQMRAGWLRTDLLQPALRVYLMIGGKLPLDRAFVAAWLNDDWRKTLPDDENARHALATHTAALFDVGFAPVPLDDALIDRAQKLIDQAPVAPTTP